MVGSLYPEQKQKSGNHLMQVKGLLFTVDVVSKARRGLSNKKMRFAETRLLEEPAVFSETWQRDATGTLNFEFFFLMHSGWYNAFTQNIQIDRERSDKLAKKEHVLVVTCNKVARWWEKFIFFNRFKRVARWWAAWGATSEVSLPMRILETVPLWPYPIGPVRTQSHNEPWV